MREILYTDPQIMLVLSSAIALRTYNYCIYVNCNLEPNNSVDIGI
jgi:hypothetical protein